MLKKYVLAAVTVMFWICIQACASAQGYIFRTEPAGASLMGVDDSVKTLWGEEGIYYSEDKEYILSMGIKEEDIIYDCKAELYEYPYDTNDTYYSEQWGHEAVGAWKLRKNSINGNGVRIGIIDTGVNSSHEDFENTSFPDGRNVCAVMAGNYTDYFNFEDEHKHGTFVAGIIAAGINNSNGIAGIADKAEIIPLKVYDTDYSSYSLDFSTIIKAMETAVNLGCDVVNLSLGFDFSAGSEDVKLLSDCVDALVKRNIIVVAAAGNNYPVKNNLSYPAAFDNVIGVGAVQKLSDGTYSKSSFSRVNSGVFVTAPGSNIKSLSHTGGYRNDDGTSFSCPMITALAACIKSVKNDVDINEFKEILQNTSRDLGDEGYDYEYGWGLADFNAAVNYMLSVTKTDGEYSDIYIIENYTNTDIECDILYAVYQEGIMKSADITGKYIPKGTTNYIVPKNGGDTRLFVWESAMNMVPYNIRNK